MSNEIKGLAEPIKSAAKVRKHTSYTVDINGIECELPLEPDSEPMHKVLPDGRIVIGYLVQDGDCNSPLEDDGIGAIHSLSRRHTNKIDPDEAIRILENDPDAIALSYFEHGQCRWGVEGTMGGMADFQWDGVSFAGIWVPDDCVRESYTGQDGLTRKQSRLRSAH